MDKRILVTGGAGFIGSNFLFYMKKKYPSYKLICIDSLTYAGNIDTIKTLIESGNISFYRVDISHKDAVEDVFRREKPDIVVNFAAESHVDRSIENPSVFLETNIIGTQVLLDMCRKYHINRFHQVSTDEVYGDLPLDRPDLLFSENSAILPSSPYSASKASADLIVNAYYRTFGVPTTISRCSNNYGPYQFPEKLIPLMIINAIHNEPLPVYGTGINVRDWIHVTDHCSAIDVIIHSSFFGETFNIGGHNEMRNIDIVRRILSMLGKNDELIRFVKDRKGHDLRYAIDSQKIRNMLGWCPQIDFDCGLRSTIDWYKENQGWWGRIISGEYKEYYKRMYSSSL